MKLCSKILAIAIIAAFTYSLTGCAAPSSFTYSNIGITLSAQCTDCPAGIMYSPTNPAVILMSNQGEGGTQLWTATVTNAPSNNITWALYPTPDLSSITTLPTCTAGSSGTCAPTESSSQVGSFNAVSGNTVLYTQNGVPIYSGVTLTQAQNMQYTLTYQAETLSPVGVPQLTTVTEPMTGIPQGDVLLSASVPNNPDKPSSMYTAYQLIQMYAATTAAGPPSVYLVPKSPTTPTGLTTSVVTVPRNTSYQFYGGAVGEPPCTSTATCLINGVQYGLYYTDNTVIWEVGATTATAVSGGNSTYGTIVNGLYTAPATIPATQPVVVMASHAVATITAVAYITIN